MSQAPPQPAPDFHVLSSLRYDPLLLASAENAQYSGNSLPSPFYLFTRHWDRMLAAARHFNWPPSCTAALEDLEHLRQKCEKAISADGFREASLKIRILLSPSGDLTVEATPTPQVSSLQRFFPGTLPPDDAFPNPEWVIYVDTEAMVVSPFTRFKTTCRAQYDSSRKRVGIESYAAASEVLLWNGRGEVMEGSLANVYFYRNGGWVTPQLSSGGQAGTVRRWLLEEGRVLEVVVRRDEVVSGEVVLLSNGVRGIWAARVVEK